MPLDASTLTAALLITGAAGIVRGVTGFGGAMVMSPPLALLLGTLILVSLESQFMRRAIALSVIVFALILLIGWRYSGRPRLSTSVGLAALSGTMLGATSIGGPPVILYLLSGPD